MQTAAWVKTSSAWLPVGVCDQTRHTPVPAVVQAVHMMAAGWSYVHHANAEETKQAVMA